MYEIKNEDVYEDFSKDKNKKKKKMFDFSNYLTKPKFCNDSNKLVVSQIKDEKAGVPIKEFVGLKHENENAVATISHNRYKDVLLNQKC